DAAISKTVESFKSWFVANGGFFHNDAQFRPDASGYKIVADKEVPADTTIVTCPFGLVVTKELATHAILSVLKTNEIPPEWTERQLICTYVCLHWAFEASPDLPESLAHLPYLEILPKPEQLRTPLHFSEKELELFRGSHLYGATIDRRNVLHNEWRRCLEHLTTATNGDVYQRRYTWERYLTAATYLSSRAFPSTLLLESSSVVTSKGSYPVLLPGVDSLNHARGRPVSWVVDPLPPTDLSGDSRQQLGISLIIHSRTQSGGELLNNYGAKPNSELILGYGFSLKGNPDDTIVLSIGGGPVTSASNQEEKKRWEVGRSARGVEGVWH
ncbi:SET domain-containing protein, partial [Thelephora ganbajun]